MEDFLWSEHDASMGTLSNVYWLQLTAGRVVSDLAFLQDYHGMLLTLPWNWRVC